MECQRINVELVFCNYCKEFLEIPENSSVYICPRCGWGFDLENKKEIGPTEIKKKECPVCKSIELTTVSETIYFCQICNEIYKLEQPEILTTFSCN